MQRKLKAVFRSSSKRKSQNEEELSLHAEAATPRSRHDVRNTMSFEEQRPRQSFDSHKAEHNSRSRPLSSVYDSRHLSNASEAYPIVPDLTQSHRPKRADDTIASDYRAYLPALSPVHDAHNENPTSLGGDRRLITGVSDLRHEEDVADRNIDRYSQSLDASARKPLPAIPVLDVESHSTSGTRSTGRNSASIGSSQPSVGTGKYSLGRDLPTGGGLFDSILPHAETSAHEKNQWKKTSWPSRTAREDTQVDWSRRRHRGSMSEGDELRMAPEPTGNLQHPPSGSRKDPDGIGSVIDGQDDIHREIEQLLDGTVDLRNTVDKDKNVEWAPAVTHEVVKPHEHEVIQHKIFREIHNYEYYHRIQPVYHIEVLPPRHWIPNPNGDGLIEISAGELPSRTGNNRRWKIVHEQVELPVQPGPAWRTEPEIIEHPTTISAEGFERKETTIIYPPTLKDMTDYEGLVQPVHFDHKTGKRWLGEITTMRKLRQEGRQVAGPDEDLDFSMKELGVALSGVPDEADEPELSTSPSFKRKPFNGPAPARLGQLGSSPRVAAVA